MPRPEIDVLIIGAGISGIGAAAHLQSSRPATLYAILEARETSGGTWDLFRYPGLRSDSDLHTFGYAFKPWLGDRALADGPSILRYLRETITEYGIEQNIRFGHKVREAHWSSDDACWTVHAEQGPDATLVQITARWLFCAGGYFRYDRGYTPDLPGLEQFGGRVVHPQSWPEGLDYSNKRVVVVGSGATAVTLVPALCDKAAHVTMLQRTPTYVLSVPRVDPVHAIASAWLGRERAHHLVRWKNVLLDRLVFAGSRRYPARARKLLHWLTARELPGGYDVDKHFAPPYNPWDQRLCAALDGDLFRVIRDGRASVVTDRIRAVTETGLSLESGAMLEADIIVTATGLELLPMAGVTYRVDGHAIRLRDTITYKGMMLTGLPNFVYALGYTNASWTLKVDLIAQHFCRLLSLMDEREYDYTVPEAPPPHARTAPLIDLTSGYAIRGREMLPRQASVAPWALKMDYLHDRRVLLDGPVGDHLRFFRTRGAVKPRASLAGIAADEVTALTPPLDLPPTSEHIQ